MTALRGLRCSFSLLTTIPMGRWQPTETDIRGAAAWFPLVGIVVGLPAYLALRLPLPAAARAALALAALVIVTGGLHEDAVADAADAAFAPASVENRLEVLADPRIGAHGSTASILLNLMRFAALLYVPPAAVLAAAIVGRWTLGLSLGLARPARTTGLGARFAPAAAPAWTTALTALALLLPASLGGGWRVALAPTAGGLAAFAVGRLLIRRFGGLNGDGHGAVGAVAELVALWVFLPVTPP